MGVGVVVVLIVLFFVLFADSEPRVDVSYLVPAADQTLLVFVNEYYYDFDRSYTVLEESPTLEPGACASQLFFEFDPEDCSESWATRKFSFATENSSGFLAYLIFEDESLASRFLNETLERTIDPSETIPYIRYDTSGFAGFASHARGQDVDELVALVIRTENGRVFTLLQRMGQIVLVSYEDTSMSRLDRRFLFATTFAYQEPAITYHNLTYDDL